VVPYQAVKDNVDVVERRIASTGAQLMILEKAFTGWSPHSEEHETVNQFERYDIPSFSTRLL
jgi:hypothetical protein